MEGQRITLDDLRRKMDQLNRTVVADLKSRRAEIYIGAAAFAGAAVLLSYCLGKRRGRRKR